MTPDYLTDLSLADIGDSFEFTFDGVQIVAVLVEIPSIPTGYFRFQDTKTGQKYQFYTFDGLHLKRFIPTDRFPVNLDRTSQDRLQDVEREMLALRSDFQNLEALYHANRETFESEIESLKEELKNHGTPR